MWTVFHGISVQQLSSLLVQAELCVCVCVSVGKQVLTYETEEVAFFTTDWKKESVFVYVHVLPWNLWARSAVEF